MHFYETSFEECRRKSGRIIDNGIKSIYTIICQKGINMSAIKTAVSIDEELFKRLEAMRKELRLSRSELFAQAIKEFLHRAETRAIIDAFNDAYVDYEPDMREDIFRSQAGRLMVERLREEDGGW